MKRLIVLVLVAAFGLSLAQVDLRWRTRPDNQAEIDVYSAASKSIDEAWDEATLTYEPGGSESASYQDVLVTEIEAGTAPDVFWIPGTDIARFAKAGLILNLADLAAADSDFNAADFYAGPMGSLTTSIDGKDALWGLPRDVSAFAVYYNADLFAEAGIDEPKAGWTWDDLKAAAEAIDGLGDEISGFGMNAWWANWGYFVNAAGSGFFNEDKSGCGLANEGTVQGLEFASNLIKSGAALSWGTDSEPPFLAGNLGMFMNGRWATPGTIANAKFKWNVAPLPVGPSGKATNWLFWGAYVVNAKTAHPAEAWDLVTRLTSADIQGQIASLGANIPSRATQDAIDLFLGTLPDSGINNQAFIDGTTAEDVRAEAPLFKGDWPAVDTAYGNAVTKVFNGEMTAQEFADTICTEVAPNFDQ
jgi:multiple sugar transport system substrate-binding protein